MALDQAAHHVGLARGPECGADLLRLLHLDQAIDDVATLHQQAMHAFIDRVDFLAQLGKRRRGGRRLRHLMKPGEFSILILRSAHSGVSKDAGPFSLMVRDGARAPPHHEGSSPPR